VMDDPQLLRTAGLVECVALRVGYAALLDNSSFAPIGFG